MDTLPHEVPIEELSKKIALLKALLSKDEREDPEIQEEIARLQGEMATLEEVTYATLTPWQRVLISRHRKRPRTVDYLSRLFSSFQSLAGDRHFGDDKAIIGGFATFAGIKCVVIGQEKGKDIESRLNHNFGMPYPEGYRKALRLMKLGEKFRLPVVTLIDTPGAYPCLEAEERGQGAAIAKNLQEMMRLKTPIISVIIGEGCSGGALGIGLGDVVGMLEHSYYSVITPEGCASILWKDVSKKIDAANALKLTAEDLLRFKIIDAMIGEPLGGAHKNPEQVFNGVRDFIVQSLSLISEKSLEALLDERYQKYRKIGQLTHKTLYS